MELLKQRIREEGIVLNNRVLKSRWLLEPSNRPTIV